MQQVIVWPGKCVSCGHILGRKNYGLFTTCGSACQIELKHKLACIGCGARGGESKQDSYCSVNCLRLENTILRRAISNHKTAAQYKELERLREENERLYQATRINRGRHSRGGERDREHEHEYNKRRNERDIERDSEHSHGHNKRRNERDIERDSEHRRGRIVRRRDDDAVANRGRSQFDNYAPAGEYNGEYTGEEYVPPCTQKYTPWEEMEEGECLTNQNILDFIASAIASVEAAPAHEQPDLVRLRQNALESARSRK
jgi:hypothetical protein